MNVRFRSAHVAAAALAVAALVPAVVFAATDAETIKVFQDAGQSGQFFAKAYGYAVLPNVGKGGRRGGAREQAASTGTRRSSARW